MKRTNELFVILILGCAAGAGCAFGGNDAQPYPDSGAKTDGKAAGGGDGGADTSGSEPDGGTAEDAPGPDLVLIPKSDSALDTAEWGRDSGGISTDTATDIVVSSVDAPLRSDVEVAWADARSGNDSGVDGPLASRLDANADTSVDGRSGDVLSGHDAGADLSEDG